MNTRNALFGGERFDVLPSKLDLRLSKALGNDTDNQCPPKPDHCGIQGQTRNLWSSYRELNMSFEPN